MAHVICAPCTEVKTGECARVCPVDCIHDAGDQYAINPIECIDCGACVDVCPVQAIFYEDEVPAQWEHFKMKNALAYEV
jgi:NAD-dependent dihydropyrimidine dehydrogenase PreA subunit